MIGAFFIDVGFDLVVLPAIDRDGPPPRGGIPRDDFRRHQAKQGAFPIIERAAEPVYFMFDIAQRLVRCLERAVLHLQRIIIALHFFQRLQTAAHRSDLFFQTRAGGKKRRDNLVKSGLDFAGAFRTEAQKIGQDRRENDQRDDARAVHLDCGSRIAGTGKEEGTLTAGLLSFPHSGFRNPKLSAPIAIG